MRICARCGSENTAVYNSRPMYGVRGFANGCIMRQRKCCDCGFRYKTAEVDYNEYLHMKEELEPELFVKDEEWG